MKKKLLITGSEGVMGRILRPALQSNYSIFGFDQHSENPWEGYFNADITDKQSIDDIFKDIGNVDLIIHLAGDSYVYSPWESVLKNNVEGAKNIYEAAHRYKVPKVIFTSSNKVTDGYELYTDFQLEDHQEIITVYTGPKPKNYYGLSKYMGEIIARYFYDQHSIKSICLRIGVVLENENPTKDSRGRHQRIWLSHRDLIQLVEKSIEADVDFGVYYGISDNTGRFHDIIPAFIDLGYRPKDNAASLQKSK